MHSIFVICGSVLLGIENKILKSTALLGRNNLPNLASFHRLTLAIRALSPIYDSRPPRREGDTLGAKKVASRNAHQPHS
jgi:hypothetical protein